MVVVEQVGGDDLVVVVGRVRERALAVAVAQRPDPRNVGAQLIINGDVAMRVDRDTGLVEPEIVGVRPTPDRDQKMRAFDLGATLRRLDRDRDAVMPARNRQRLGPSRIAISSRSKILATSADTSSSSRAIRRGCTSITVTALPNRRYIWANSRPT